MQNLTSGSAGTPLTSAGLRSRLDPSWPRTHVSPAPWLHPPVQLLVSSAWHRTDQEDEESSQKPKGKRAIPEAGCHLGRGCDTGWLHRREGNEGNVTPHPLSCDAERPQTGVQRAAVRPGGPRGLRGAGRAAPLLSSRRPGGLSAVGRVSRQEPGRAGGNAQAS